MRAVTLHDDAALIDHAQPIAAELRVNLVRVGAPFSATPFQATIPNEER